MTTDAGRYALISAPGEKTVVAFGHWTCGSRSAAAVLDQVSGTVWLFAAWPGPGATVNGRPVARVHGATAIAPGPTAGGCEELVVARRGQPPVRIEAEPPAR